MNKRNPIIQEALDLLLAHAGNRAYKKSIDIVYNYIEHLESFKRETIIMEIIRCDDGK